MDATRLFYLALTLVALAFPVRRFVAWFWEHGLVDDVAIFLTPRELGPEAVPAWPDERLPSDPEALVERLGLGPGDGVMVRKQLLELRKRTAR